ncbi:MAG TPA: 30S ribosomal protein S4 [Bacteroidetes bacterium]|jgi:small subunit ribosomal protein S4|nr:30S ribosomal protein S4 [Bacteroidota bacterium]
MARYRGPKTKISRKFGESIYGFDKYFERKKYPPGQHGNQRRRKVKSEYATQLMEKQKMKYTYGVLEKPFRNLYVKASRKKGITGEILLQLLEARLDNAVFRMGLASTRRFARQMVNHKHITVNGKIVNIPSYSLKPGDLVGIKLKSQGMEMFYSASDMGAPQHKWLEWDSAKLTGVFVNYPEREVIPEKFEEHLIIELYSK